VATTHRVDDEAEIEKTSFCISFPLVLQKVEAIVGGRLAIYRFSRYQWLLSGATMKDRSLLSRRRRREGINIDLDLKTTHHNTCVTVMGTGTGTVASHPSDRFRLPSSVVMRGLE
jgi:hypothetical protein